MNHALPLNDRVSNAPLNFYSCTGSLPRIEIYFHELVLGINEVAPLYTLTPRCPEEFIFRSIQAENQKLLTLISFLLSYMALVTAPGA